MHLARALLKILMLGAAHLLIFTITSGVSFGEETTPSFERIVNQVLQYRRNSCFRGQVKLHAVNRSRLRQETEFEYTIVFDGNKLRFDRKSRLLGSPKWTRPEKYIVTEDRFIEDIDDELIVNSGRRSHSDMRSYADTVFHPRALGMTVSGTSGMIHNGFGELIGRADRIKPTVSKDNIGGTHTWRLEFQLPNGANVSVWVSPRQGYSLVRGETRLESPNGQVLQSVVSELTQYPEGGIWYPSRTEHELSLNGEWHERQTIFVRKAEFGRDIDPTVFTLAGLDLKAGRVVQDSTLGVPTGLIWDGKGTRRMTVNDTLGRRSSSLTRISWKSWLLLSNAVICAVLASILLIRFLRARRV